MNKQIIALPHPVTGESDINLIFFKPSLPGPKLAIDPGTVITIIKTAKDLYDLMQQSKEKKKNQAGDWLLQLDRKLDQVLAELAEIKSCIEELRRLVLDLPFQEAVYHLDKNIRYCQMNIFDLKEDPADGSLRNLFRGIYADLQKDMLGIQDKRAFQYLYSMVLAFIIQYDIALLLGNSRHSRLALIDLLRSYLQAAANPAEAGSFGQILQILLNSRQKLRDNYQAYNGTLRRFFIIETHYIPGHGGKDPEPAEFWARLARIALQYRIEGNLEQGFSSSYEQVGPHEWREVFNREELAGLYKEEESKRLLREELNNITASYNNAAAQYREIEKDIHYYEGICQSIEQYLQTLDELEHKITTEPNP